MFSLAEIKTVVKALVGMQKSVARLANKEEQPDSVSREYRIVYGDLTGLIKKFESMYVEQEAKEKLQAAGAAKK